MLRELRIRDLALIESESLLFESGLNVLSGETGAGKSLVLLALSMLLGGRLSRDAIRAGARSASVEGLLELDHPALLSQLADLCGCESDDEEFRAPAQILVKRRADQSGRNRCEVQGHLVSVGTLRKMGVLLVEIHGQSEHQSLLDPVHQADLLDRWAGLEAKRTTFTSSLARWRALRERLRAAQRSASEREARLTQLDEIIETVDRVAPVAGESDDLRRERALLADAERYAGALVAGLAQLERDDEASPVVDRVGRAAREIDRVAELLPSVAQAQAALDEAGDRIADAVRALQDAARDLTTDPARLADVDERLESLTSLLRRLGPTEEDVLTAAENARIEAQDLRDADDAGGRLDEELAAAAQRVIATGLALNKARRKAGGRFAKAVGSAFGELGMAAARLEVEVLDPASGPPADLAAGATVTGLGTTRFLASTNAGEAAHALARIASGGELARVALTLKSELAAADSVPVLVFDEVDADVGPRLGAPIGRRLRQVATGRQVIVVSHLPQVAAHAAHHLRVSKRTEKGRTHTQVEAVSGDVRLLEIAAMIRGEERAHEAREQAQAMLDEAGRKPAEAGTP